MSLSQKIADALDAPLGPEGLPGDFTIESGADRLTLRLTASGPVGLAFDTLRFESGARPEWSDADLGDWSHRIASRVTYLMEPLVVLEHDTVGGAVEMRSEAPTARGELRSFYEMRLGRKGDVSLSRVTFDATTRRRRATSCQMTREVLERLADDLVACAS